MGNCLRNNVSSTHAHVTYTQHEPTLQGTPQLPAPSAPLPNHSPLQGLQRRPPRSSTPSQPTPSRPTTSQPTRPQRSGLENRILLEMQGMAHTLLNAIAPTLNNEALHAVHTSAHKLLKRMSDCALGKSAVGGSDDIAEKIKRIQNRIAAHYANPDAAAPPVDGIEHYAGHHMFKQMRQLAADVDLEIQVAKAGGDTKFLQLEEGLILKQDVAAQVANMVSGIEETYDAPSEDHGRRIVNLLKNLTEMAPLPRGVLGTVRERREDPVALADALQTLVRRYPTLGNNPNWKKPD